MAVEVTFLKQLHYITNVQIDSKYGWMKMNS